MKLWSAHFFAHATGTEMAHACQEEQRVCVCVSAADVAAGREILQQSVMLEEDEEAASSLLSSAVTASLRSLITSLLSHFACYVCGHIGRFIITLNKRAPLMQFATSCWNRTCVRGTPTPLHKICLGGPQNARVRPWCEVWICKWSSEFRYQINVLE